MDEREGGLTRRRFLRLGGAAAVGAAGLPLIAACGSAAGTQSQNAQTLALPDYVAFKGPKPDLPAASDGVAPAFYAYPKNPVRSVTKPPVDGGTVTAMLITFIPPATPVAQNQAWQAVDQRLGAKLVVDPVSPADYQSKFETTIAGGQLPDLLFYTYNKAVPDLPQFLQSKCTDLTPYLSKAAIKEWGNLANIPSFVWQSSSLNGRIWGIPCPNGRFGSGYFYYQDMVDEVGGSLPKNADDYLRLLKEMTQPKSNRWGFCAVQNSVFALPFCQAMWRAPNGWSVDHNGKFTNVIETSENKEAVAFDQKLYQAGVFYPDSISFSNPQRKNVFNAGKAFMTIDGFGAWGGSWNGTVRKDAKVRIMLPPGHAGGKGRTGYTTSYYGITLIPKTSEKRVRELLGVGNFFAAPFGTEEYLLSNFGVQGVDYTFDSTGNPVQNQRGKAEVPQNPPGGGAWQFIAAPPDVIYASDKEYVQTLHQTEVEGLATAVSNPTTGLYSATDSTKGVTLNQTVTDALTDIVSGRRPMSDYDTVVSEWRSQGGNQIRNEYQQAWRRAHHT